MQPQVFGAAPGTKEYFRRHRALLDFLAMGPRRSVEGLWREYVEKRRRDRDGSLGLRKDIPTTNKTLLYRWAKEDRWFEQAQVFDQEAAEKELQNLEKLRERVYDELALMAHDVLTELRQLLREGRQEIRFKVIESWLDRIGVVRQSTPVRTKEQLREERERQEKESALYAQMPPDDAPDSVWAEWLAKLHEIQG